MKNITNPSGLKSNTKVAPVSCHCKLSLLVVHLQYLAEKRKTRPVTKVTPALGEAHSLFYHYL